MLESIKIGVSAQNSISGESVQRLARGLNVNRRAGSWGLSLEVCNWS